MLRYRISVGYGELTLPDIDDGLDRAVVADVYSHFCPLGSG
jgi:hypothetical protein